MRKIFLYVLASVLAPLAHAGRVVGNGGDVVVCRGADNAVTGVELLDFYEARVERDQIIKLDPSKSVDENFEMYLSRLGARDAFQEKHIQGLYKQFEGETRFLSGTELVDIPDSGHLSFPAGCKVEQIAIQKNPKYPGEKRYTISKDLWDRLSNADRAGLIMHEIIYRRSIEEVDQSPNLEINSIPSRYLNSIIASDDLRSLDTRAYIDVLNQVFFDFTSWNDWTLLLKETQFYDNGKISNTAVIFDKKQRLNVNGEVTILVDEKAPVEIDFNAKKEGQIDSLIWEAENQDINVGSHKFSIKVRHDWPAKLTFQDGKLAGIDGAIHTLPKKTFNFERKSFECEGLKFVDQDHGRFSCDRMMIKSYGKAPYLQTSYVVFDSDGILASAEFFDGYIVNYHETGYPKEMKCLLKGKHAQCRVDVKYKGNYGGAYVLFTKNQTPTFDSKGNYLKGGDIVDIWGR